MVYFLLSVSRGYIFLFEKVLHICYWSCYNTRIVIYLQIFLTCKMCIQNAFRGFSWHMGNMFQGPYDTCAMSSCNLCETPYRGHFCNTEWHDINKLCYKFHWNNWRNNLEILRWWRSLKANLMDLVLIIAQFGSFLKSLIG